jgi:hypothetical protein
MRYNQRNGASACNTHAAPNHRPELAGATAVAKSKPTSTFTPKEVQEFWSKVEVPFQPSCCWTLRGYHDPNGYAYFLQKVAHRVSFELLIGDIPADMVIDHLCRNPSCINPDHMEVITNGLNVLRGYGSPARNKRKTHCQRGHEFTPENTIIRRSGYRKCRECHRAYLREYHARYRLRRNAEKREQRKAAS